MPGSGVIVVALAAAYSSNKQAQKRGTLRHLVFKDSYSQWTPLSI